MGELRGLVILVDHCQYLLTYVYQGNEDEGDGNITLLDAGNGGHKYEHKHNARCAEKSRSGEENKLNETRNEGCTEDGKKDVSAAVSALNYGAENKEQTDI